MTERKHIEICGAVQAANRVNGATAANKKTRENLHSGDAILQLITDCQDRRLWRARAFAIRRYSRFRLVVGWRFFPLIFWGHRSTSLFHDAQSED
jgi:hypothetical protein